MLTLQGKYNSAVLYTDTAEQSTIAQIITLLNQEFVSGSKICIMPDAHAGMGSTIGTTMTITDKVVPNLVGVDIGCGMETVLLEDEMIALKALDDAIGKYIPSGFQTRNKAHDFSDEINLSTLCAAPALDLKRARFSIGTLGGGNHFIELGKDEDGKLYLVVHSGSRNLGKQVCEHYQKLAMKQQGNRFRGADRALAYLEGALLDDYLHDMALTQHYADLNRRAMVQELQQQLGFKIKEQFTTTHNYIDLDAMILRKGAISAKAGERVLIPMNMRDGSLLCIGKGNADWNCSAPHGAGRILSRTAAKSKITMAEFEASMQGIYSTTIDRKTLDEAPAAYKPMDEIIANMGDTAEIIKTIKPLYNYKAVE